MTWTGHFRALLCFVAAAVLPAAAETPAVGTQSALSQSAWQKLESLQRGLPPGASVRFGPAELDAWVRDVAQSLAPQGARNPRLVLGAGQATGYAEIDFLKMRQAATGEPAGWLLRNLLAGVRPVQVTALVQSRNGRARVDVARVEISGVAMEGAALDFLIDAFVRPLFPNATVAEWFDLQHHVDRFTVSPGGVAVYVRR